MSRKQGVDIGENAVGAERLREFVDLLNQVFAWNCHLTVTANGRFLRHRRKRSG
ncbi:hypothetical protein RISK_004487 [Rhodopirellula islandica]|uniref:Uncharacterized protein n=1 Tax=Rhodopirellula islandica TaxID=595434 RepID=A0A0J1BAE6_RHOIS|nr:hypothetical protein RISK_004487 [Rhodopirellula islandica]